LLKVPTFRVSMIAGSLSRMGGSGANFLFSLMFQTIFGMSAAQSGRLSFFMIAGSLVSRLGGPTAIQRCDIRSVLVFAGSMVALLLILAAMIRPATPIIVDVILLVAVGLFQSVSLLVFGAIAYADIGRERAVAATSFYTALQQATMSVGITIQVLVLSGSEMMTGSPAPNSYGFSCGFAAAAFCFLASACASARLHKGAGANLRSN
jgi:hypothetical protein